VLLRSERLELVDELAVEGVAGDRRVVMARRLLEVVVARPESGAVLDGQRVAAKVVSQRLLGVGRRGEQVVLLVERVEVLVAVDVGVDVGVDVLDGRGRGRLAGCASGAGARGESGGIGCSGCGIGCSGCRRGGRGRRRLLEELVDEGDRRCGYQRERCDCGARRHHL
jgi:hypothetical protein